MNHASEHASRVAAARIHEVMLFGDVLPLTQPSPSQRGGEGRARIAREGEGDVVRGESDV
jgi:hypothetical protein